MIEIVVVIAAIAVLSTIGTVSYIGYTQRNQTNQNHLNAEEVIRKMTIWTAVEKRYPDTLGEASDSSSLMSTISTDTREYLVSSSNSGLPSQDYPKNIEVRFCYRSTDSDTPVGARVYYWDLQEKVEKYQYYGNSEEPDVSCRP